MHLVTIVVKRKLEYRVSWIAIAVTYRNYQCLPFWGSMNICRTQFRKKNKINIFEFPLSLKNVYTLFNRSIIINIYGYTITSDICRWD